MVDWQENGLDQMFPDWLVKHCGSPERGQQFFRSGTSSNVSPFQLLSFIRRKNRKIFSFVLIPIVSTKSVGFLVAKESSYNLDWVLKQFLK